MPVATCPAALAASRCMHARPRTRCLRGKWVKSGGRPADRQPGPHAIMHNAYVRVYVYFRSMRVTDFIVTLTSYQSHRSAMLPFFAAAAAATMLSRAAIITMKSDVCTRKCETKSIKSVVNIAYCVLKRQKVNFIEHIYTYSLVLNSRCALHLKLYALNSGSLSKSKSPSQSNLRWRQSATIPFSGARERPILHLDPSTRPLCQRSCRNI